jgi:hypothetical protein
MIPKLPPFRAQQPLVDQLGAAKLNRILAELESLRIISVVGGTFKRLPGGTEIVVGGPKSGGTRAARRPFELDVVPDPVTPGAKKIRVYASTLAGGTSADLSFSPADEPPYLLTPAVGVVQGGITIDADGLVTSRWLEIVETQTADTDDTFYVEIGTVAQDADDNWIVSNTVYGPIAAVICRNWFAAEAPFYTVEFF